MGAVSRPPWQRQGWRSQNTWHGIGKDTRFNHGHFALPKRGALNPSGIERNASSLAVITLQTIKAKVNPPARSDTFQSRKITNKPNQKSKNNGRHTGQVKNCQPYHDRNLLFPYSWERLHKHQAHGNQHTYDQKQGPMIAEIYLRRSRRNQWKEEIRKQPPQKL